MSDDGWDYGPLESFEVTWASGHVEVIQAHQVCTPLNAMFGPPGGQRWTFHGEFDGQWRLLLTAGEKDILRVRNVTRTEPALEAGDAS
jgi:hypothetical protein